MDLGTKFILYLILTLLCAIANKGIPLKNLTSFDLFLYILLFNIFLGIGECLFFNI